MSLPVPLIVWGSSGHASVVADVVRLDGRFVVHGCIDDRDPSPRDTLAGPVLGSRELLPALHAHGVTHLIVAIGDNAVRLRLARLAVDMGFTLATVIHPRAVVASSAILGAGCVVMANAVVNPGVIVGDNVILNTAATVDHDDRLGDGVHVCPGAHLAGGVHVGPGTMIGVGACVRDRIRIGAGCIIGAGAAVVADIPDHSVAVGVPARVVRRLDPIIV